MQSPANHLLRVELVGGPICGKIVDWPEDQATQLYSVRGTLVIYAIDTRHTSEQKLTATWKGYDKE